MAKKHNRDFKVLFASLILLVLVIAVFVFYRNTQTLQNYIGQKFSDKQTGVSFKYPYSIPTPEASFDKDNNEGKISFEDKRVKGNDSQVSKVIISVHPTIKFSTLDNFSADVQANLRQANPGIELLKQDRITVSDVPAIRQYYSFNNIENYSELIYFLFDDKRIQIHRSPVWPEFDQDFDKIINSLQLQHNYLVVSKWKEHTNLVLVLPYGAQIDGNKVSLKDSEFWVDRTSLMGTGLCTTKDFALVCGSSWDYILVDQDTPKVRPIDTIEKIAKWHRGTPHQYFAIEPLNIKVGGLTLNHFIIYKNKPDDVFTVSQIEWWKESLRTIQEVRVL